MNREGCKHTMLFLGSHPSFKKGWLCYDCRQQIEGFDLRSYRDEYVVVMAAIRINEVETRADAKS